MLFDSLIGDLFHLPNHYEKMDSLAIYEILCHLHLLYFAFSLPCKNALWEAKSDIFKVNQTFLKVCPVRNKLKFMKEQS